MSVKEDSYYYEDMARMNRGQLPKKKSKKKVTRADVRKYEKDPEQWDEDDDSYEL